MHSSPRATDHLRVDTGSLPWAASDTVGVHRKSILATRARATGGCEIALVRLAAGASLPPPTRSGATAQTREIVVVDGTWTVPEGDLGASSYSRRPAQLTGQNVTNSGCTLLVRDIELEQPTSQIVHVPFATGRWLPGQGNLQVRPLYSDDPEGAALVQWPEGERFVPHRHWGGEEIFVLSGTFRDEHGEYPAGTWMQSQHLSAHDPFVVEATVIFVKTGHLPQGG